MKCRMSRDFIYLFCLVLMGFYMIYIQNKCMTKQTVMMMADDIASEADIASNVQDSKGFNEAIQNFLVSSSSKLRKSWLDKQEMKLRGFDVFTGDSSAADTIPDARSQHYSPDSRKGKENSGNHAGNDGRDEEDDEMSEKEEEEMFDQLIKNPSVVGTKDDGRIHDFFDETDDEKSSKPGGSSIIKDHVSKEEVMKGDVTIIVVDENDGRSGKNGDKSPASTTLGSTLHDTESKHAEEKTMDEDEEDEGEEDEDDNSDKEDEQVEKDSEFTYVEYVIPSSKIGSNSSASAAIIPEIRLKPQVKGPKAFKAAGTKFSSLFEGWQHAGWIRKSDTAYLSSVSLILTKPITVVPGSTGKMISQISHSSCIGGSKGAQLRCRVSFAAKQGCTFQDLGISPQQYNMWAKGDCENFFNVAVRPSNKHKLWIGKVGGSYHGKYMTIYKGLTKTIKSKYGTCKMDRSTGGGYIMQEYISNPALIGGYKFDVRTFMLIASTKPFLVFYHDGFARKGGTKYSNNTDDKLAHITNHESQADNSEHFWGFSRLGSVLHDESGFAKDYMQTRFRNLAKHATNYVFQSARSRLQRRTGAFMLFGLDWMVDTKGHLHLLEANGNPTIRHYPGTELTPAIWRDMASLLTAIHMDTNQIFDPKVSTGFHWNGWDLIFSEPEEKVTNQVYNPCDYRKKYIKCHDPNVCPIW